MALAILPGPGNTQTGTFKIAFNMPVLIHQISIAPPNLELVWQGMTNGLYTIESVSSLATMNIFQTLKENIAGTNLLQRVTVPIELSPSGFYRIKQMKGSVL